MNDILVMSGDKWDEIADSFPYDPECSMDWYFKEKFKFEFITYISNRQPGAWLWPQPGYHLYRITDPALYTAYLMIH